MGPGCGAASSRWRCPRWGRRAGLSVSGRAWGAERRSRVPAGPGRAACGARSGRAAPPGAGPGAPRRPGGGLGGGRVRCLCQPCATRPRAGPGSPAAPPSGAGVGGVDASGAAAGLTAAGPGSWWGRVGARPSPPPLRPFWEAWDPLPAREAAAARGRAEG